MVCSGLEPGAAGWQVQTKPRSYGGHPKINCLLSLPQSASNHSALFICSTRTASFQTCLTIGLVKMFISLYQRAPQLHLNLFMRLGLVLFRRQLRQEFNKSCRMRPPRGRNEAAMTQPSWRTTESKKAFLHTNFPYTLFKVKLNENPDFDDVSFFSKKANQTKCIDKETQGPTL